MPDPMSATRATEDVLTHFAVGAHLEAPELFATKVLQALSDAGIALVGEEDLKDIEMLISSATDLLRRLSGGQHGP